MLVAWCPSFVAHYVPPSVIQFSESLRRCNRCQLYELMSNQACASRSAAVVSKIRIHVEVVARGHNSFTIHLTRSGASLNRDLSAPTVTWRGSTGEVGLCVDSVTPYVLS